MHSRKKDRMQEVQDRKENENMQHTEKDRDGRERRRWNLHGIRKWGIRRTDRKMQEVHSKHIISMGIKMFKG